jgi:hypothetical protein
VKESNKALFPIISFFATVVLTLIASVLLKLDDKDSFVVFATGTSVSVALTLIEQRLQTDIKEAQQHIVEELRRAMELYRLCAEINDAQLEGEITSLAKRLSAGEVPSHIAAVRIPVLYERAERRVYASNVSRTVDDLTRWATSARFRSIIEVSRRRRSSGVKFVRTFLLTRVQVIDPGGVWNSDCTSILEEQAEAGIEVRIIWLEDLQTDTVTPTRRLDRNFTIFDDTEVVETTDVQVIYRLPSKRLQEIIDLSTEQLKYSVSFPPALVVGRGR